MEKDVIIPPLPSDKKRHLEKGFLKAEELPAFEEHEYLGIENTDSHHNKKIQEKHHFSHEEKKAAETHIHHKTTHETRNEASYEQLPYSVVHKVVRGTCLVAMLLWLVLIVLLGLWVGTFNTFIGLMPILLTIIVTYIVLDNYHLEHGFIMVFPFIFTGIFFVLGLSDNLPKGMDYGLLSSVNIVFGLVFDIAIIVHYSILKRHRKAKTEQEAWEEELKKEAEKQVMEESWIEKLGPIPQPEQSGDKERVIIRLESDEDVKGFVSSIEDKSKAINAAIGRVYSVKHGGSESLRKKIRIDAEHYNEINELKKLPLDKRRILAIELLRKIKDKLDLLNKPENQVFDKSELQHLSNLVRDSGGNDKILEVLIKNDKDPVKQYYDGALEFCDEALDELVAKELEAMKAKAAERKQRKIERAKAAIEEAKKKD